MLDGDRPSRDRLAGHGAVDDRPEGVLADDAEAELAGGSLESLRGPVDKGAEFLNEGGLDRVFERIILRRDRRGEQQGQAKGEREGQSARPCRCGRAPGLRHQNFQLAPSITLRGISRRVIGLPVSGC